MHAINFTAVTAGAAIRACFGDKAAALTIAADAIHTASVRTILHGDCALFRAMQEAAESRKGAAAKAMSGRILAAESAATEAKAAAYPTGRKGKATSEQTDAAESSAAPIAAAFLEACQTDAADRSTKAKAGALKAAETKAKAAETAKAETPQSEGVQGVQGVITLAELLADIRQGKAAAIMMAQSIRGALNEFEAAAAEAAAIETAKAAAIAKAAKAAKAADAKAAKAADAKAAKAAKAASKGLVPLADLMRMPAKAA